MECYLITYDIPNDRRRQQVAHLLQDHGQRVQFSVFEIWVEASTRRRLLKALRQIVKEEEDSVRLYRLCAVCQQQVMVLGRGQPPQAPGAIII